MANEQSRDTTIDILKGIGILLVVVGHSECPLLLSECISSFHMPLFFIASGFFFSEAYLDDKKKFLIKKIKGVYLPYLKWSIIFLILHNVFFYCGIINSQYGSSTRVEHLYTLQQILSKFFKIAFTMSGHEGFLLGAYWFMRALFVGSVLFCFFSWLFSRFLKTNTAIATASVFFAILGGGCSYFNVHPNFFPAGFYREFMAVFFIGCGWFIKNKKDFLCHKSVVFVSLIVFISCIIIHPTSLSSYASFYDWIIIPFSGISGFVLTYYLSKQIFIESKLLNYMGRSSLYILTFHFLMFKPAALFYSFVYDLDWHVIGCHPVANQIHDNWFWIIYTLTSLFFSLSVMQILRKMKVA